MKTPREKYCNDAHYKVLVDTMLSQIIDCNYTPSEMREASILASIIYEERHIRRFVNIPYTKDLEEALKIVNGYLEKDLTNQPKEEGKCG